MSKTKYTDKLMKTAPQLGIHSIITEMTEGTLPIDQFRNLVIQDMIINDYYKKFMAVLIAKIPPKIHTIGNQKTVEFLAHQIANQDKEKVNDRICHELRIKREEINPSMVTKAVCDFLMSTVYNKTYKDALVVLFASTKCIPEQIKSSGNPLFDEWLQTHVASVNRVGNWAVNAINQIREDDEVNSKHQHLFDYATKYENTFWESIQHPELYSWPC